MSVNESLNPVAGHLRAIAGRQTSAVDKFIDLLIESFGITVDEAEKVFALYRRTKAIKLDTWNGRYNVSHGAFWDRAVIQRAIDLNEDQ